MSETSPHARTFAVRLIPVSLFVDAAAYPGEGVEDGHVKFKFAKVTARQRSEYLSQLKDRRRAALIADLKESGLAPDQVFVELDALREAVYGNKQWIDFINSPAGQEAVVRDAVHKHHPQANAAAVQDAVESLDGTSMLLISEICNVPLEKPEPPKPPTTEAPSGNPQMPTETSQPPAVTTTGSTPQP